MPLASLQFSPGINKEGTLYSNKGGWYFMDKMRFRQGLPEKIGGWQKYMSNLLLGVARSILVTSDLAGNKNDGVGTHLKYYVVAAAQALDVTPLRYSDALANNPFATTNLSTTVTVTDVASGAAANDYVTFAGSAAVNGIPAASLNTNLQIVTIVDVDHYTVVVDTPANATSSGGGAAVTAQYEIHVGSSSQIYGSGWGAGPWGTGHGWGTASSSTVPGDQMRLWSQCSYGQNIVINPRNGAIYMWDASIPSNRALNISTLSTADNVPTVATEVLISENSRQVFAFGANQIGSATQDQMNIRFAAYEDVGKWYPRPDNAAGSLRLSQGSRIITAAQSHGEIVVFTDVAMYSLRNSGYPYYWGSTLLSTGQSIIGPNAKATVNQTIYWMGRNNFYAYDGQTRTIPCPIKDFVFSRLNIQQTDKVFAGINSAFNEAWWLYPSTDGSGENDSYVLLNYLEGTWSYGAIARTVWADAGIEYYPVSISPTGQMFSHELGTDDGSTDPASAMPAYIQSSPLELDPAGNNFAFANRVIPDVTFRPGDSSAVTPSVNFIFYPQDYPGANEKTGSSSTVSQVSTVTIEQFTQQAWIRLRGRAMMFRVESNNLGVAFRLGNTRIDVRPDGHR